MDVIRLLKGKARGFRRSLANMTDKQREQLPSPQYRAEYNELRQLVLQALPEMEKFMPPTLDDDVHLEEGLVARYVEIQTYVEQISQILTDATLHEAPRVVGHDINPYE